MPPENRRRPLPRAPQERGHQPRKEAESEEAPKVTPDPLRVNVEAIPVELRSIGNWVAWRSDPPKGKNPKRRKVPIDANRHPSSGRVQDCNGASSTDAKTWAPLAVAIAYADRYALDGIGFMFEGSGYAGVDLDNCRDPDTGEIEAWARAVIDRLQSYTEVSTNGTGVHVIVRGVLPEGKRKLGDIEMYDSGRYFVMTGSRIAGTPTTVEERSSQLAQLHAEVFAKKQRARTPHSDPTATSGIPDDDSLLERAGRARNGPKFRALFGGDLLAYSSQSEADLALCGMLAFYAGPDPSRIDRLFRRSALMRDKWDELRGDATYGAKTIEESLAGRTEFHHSMRRSSTGKAGSADQDSAAQVGHEREDIIVGPDHHLVLDLVEEVLGRSDSPAVFNRGGILVRAIRIPADSNTGGIRRSKGQAVVTAATDYGLLDLMNKRARFFQWRMRGNEWVKEQVPASLGIARELMGRKEWASVPPLHALVAGAIILPNGAVLASDGFHRRQGVFVDLGGLERPDIAERPTRDDARTALEALRDLIEQFPFVSDADRSVAIAAILTSVSRLCYDCAPLIALSAPTAGTGKSLLADLIAIIATGAPAPAISQSRDPEEMRKLILTLLLESSQVAMVDNVVHALDDAPLCSALSQSTVRGRVLGVSQSATVSTRHTLWMASGNNLILGGDMRRRALACYLDAKLERPWTRGDFKIKDIRSYVQEHRGALLVDALTIARWGVTARKEIEAQPSVAGLEAFGGFEGWARAVRDPLVALDAADPVVVLQRNLDHDPESADLRLLVAAWHKQLGSARVSVAEAVDKADESLRRAMSAVAGGDALGAPNGRKLGRYLAKYAARVVDGCRFENVGDRSGVAVWRLAEVGQP